MTETQSIVAGRREYRYRTKLLLIVPTFLMFCVGTPILVAAAIHNDRGLSLFGMFEFGVTLGAAYHWLLAAASAALAGFTGAMTYVSLFRKKWIRVDKVTLTIPASVWSTRHIQIHFGDIFSVEEHHGRYRRWIRLRHDGGRHDLDSLRLPSRAAYRELLSLIRARVPRSASSVDRVAP